MVFLGIILFPMQGHCAETVARNVAESDTVTYNEPLLDRENVRQKDVAGTEEEEEEIMEFGDLAKDKETGKENFVVYMNADLSEFDENQKKFLQES